MSKVVRTKLLKRNLKVYVKEEGELSTIIKDQNKFKMPNKTTNTKSTIRPLINREKSLLMNYDNDEITNTY